MFSVSRRSLAVLSVVLSSLLPAQAQTKPSDPFAAESYVIRQSDWVYSEAGDGTGFREHTVAVTVQSDAALKLFGVVGVPFAGASEHVEFKYARVRHKDGTLTDTPPDGMMEQPQPVTQQAPFYSDLKEAELPIKNLQVGDTVEWQARITRSQAEVPGFFWGQETFVPEGSVVLEESIEVRVPSNSAATVWTDPELKTQPTVKTEGGMKIYALKGSQLEPTAGPEGEAAKKAKQGKAQTPEQELDSKKGKLPTVAWTNFHDWAAVGEWYQKLQGSRTVPDAEITAKAKQLTVGMTTDEEKVRALYAYVSAQIRYIGVAFGVGRFQPHEAADVLHSQYGDCKDKETLLASLLAAVGIPSDAVLIGAEVRFNEAVPSPGSFNHLITHLHLQGQEVWLDSTEEIAPFQMMYAAIRDQKALVIPPAGTPTIETTPADPPFPAIDTWNANGTLDIHGIVESHIVLTLRGDEELAMRSVIRQIPPANYDKAVQGMLGAFGYAGTPSHADLMRPDDTVKPFSLAFDYHREKPGDWDELRFFPQILPLELPAPDEKEPPTAPLDLGSPRTQNSHAEVKLPAGWSAEPPAPEHRKSEWLTYDEVSKFEGGVLITDAKLQVLKRYVPVSQWKTYKTFYDSVDAMQAVQLVRALGEKAESSKETTAGADLSADKLVEQAQDEIRQQLWDDAQETLKKAKAKDAKVPRLWSTQAQLELLRGEANQAIEDSRKELALHPQEKQAYAVLSTALAMQNNTAEAINALQQWAKADPDNAQPEIVLASVEFSRKRYPAAMEAATKAIELLGQEEAEKNENLIMILGGAQLKSGLTSKGEATLTKLLDQTDNPVIMNGAAYEMADEHVALPLDEQKVREALTRMDEQTQDWTVDSPPRTVSPTTATLYATWDTMGWIYFREGKLDEAHDYLTAALINRSDKTVAEHLEELEAPKGAPITGTGPKSMPDWATGQAERTFHLGKLSADGWAEYKLLLLHGKIDRVEPASEKSQPGVERVLQGMDVSRMMPKDSGAKLVKHGMVNCIKGSCDLIMIP